MLRPAGGLATAPVLPAGEQAMLAAAVVQSIYRSDAVVQILDVCGLSKEFSSTSTAFWPRVHHLHAVASKSWHHAHHVSAISSSCQHACVGSHRWPASTGWLHTSWKARHRRGGICIIEELSASASSQHTSLTMPSNSAHSRPSKACSSVEYKQRTLRNAEAS